MAAEQAITELIIDGSDIERASRIVGGAFDHMGDRAIAAQAKFDAAMARQLKIYGTDLPQSLNRVENAYNRLQGRLDPVVAAQQRMEREMTQSLGVINRAVLLNLTTEQQAARDIARLKQQQIDHINQVRDAQLRANAANDNEFMGGGAAFRRTTLGYQGFDIGQGLMAGTPLGIIAAQQGPQLAQLYAGQGGLNALWKDSIGLLGGLARAAAPWLIAAAGIYGAYRLIASFGQEAALAIDSSTQALADQAAPLGTVRSQIDDLAQLQMTYRDAIVVTGDASTDATNKVIANTRREFEAKRALLELEGLRQEAALKANDLLQRQQGLDLRQQLASGVLTRVDPVAAGMADPRIGSVPFVRLPDSITGLEKTQNLIDQSPAAQKLKELRAEGELTRLTFERLQEALKATFDDGTLIKKAGDARDALTGRPMNNLPMPQLRGIDDQPGAVDFMQDFSRQSQIRMRQMQAEAGAIGLAGSALENYRFAQDALLDAYRKNIDLTPDLVRQIEAQAEAYGLVADAAKRAQLGLDLRFERQQLFRTEQDRNIAARVRETGQGLDGPFADYIRRTDQLSDYRDLGIDLLSGIRDGALSGSENVGEAIMQAIGDAASNYAKKITDRMIEDLVTSGMKALGLDDFGADTQMVSSMQVTATSVTVTGSIAGNPIDAVPRMFNPANENGPPRNLSGIGSPNAMPTAALGVNGLVPVDQVANYIRQAAPQYGIDPTIALRVARSEGLGEGIWQSNYINAAGRRETSYGPFQLLKGGGLGDVFQRQTGMDAADPASTLHQVDFALQQARQNGWGAWYGAAKVGVGRWDGINQSAPLDPLTTSVDKLVPAIDTVTTKSIAAANGFADATSNVGTFGNSLSQLAQQFVSGISGGPGWGVNNLFGLGLSNVGAGFNPTPFGFAQMIGIPGFASGTESAPPGWAWIGERGPELMKMRGGEVIRDNRASMAMAGGGRPVVNVVPTVHNNAGAQVRTEVEQDEDGNVKIDTYVDRIVAQKMNRPGSAIERGLRQRNARLPRDRF